MANFLWGANGEEVTPEEIATRKQIAQSLLTQANQTPANYWTQGVSNMVNALMGGFMQGRAMKAERANDDYSQAKMASLSGDGMFGGAGTSVNNPQTNAYIGSDSVMKDQPAGDQSDPFGGSGTDVNHPLVQALLPQGGAPASSAPVSPVAAALTNPQTGVASAGAQNGASDLLAQGLLEHIRQAESAGDNTAKNPRSSATGAFQFTNPTWTGLMRQHPELGLTADGRTDPAQSEAAAKQLASDNIAYMLAKGVQNPTQGQAYLAHFAGARGATNLIQADQNAPAASILSPAQVAANPFLRGMTAGQVQDWAAQKMGQGTSPAPAQPMAAAQPAPAVGQGQAPSYPYYTDPGPSLAQISDVLNDPHMNQSAKGYASALLQNKLQIQQLGAQYAMRQADPAYRLQMQRNQAEINEANARVAALSGKNQMTPEQQNLQWRAQQAGLVPGSPEYQQFILSGGKDPSAKGNSQTNFLSPQEISAAGLDPTHVYATQPNGAPPKDMGENLETKTANRVKTLQASKAATDDALASIDRVSEMSSSSNKPGSFVHGALGHYYSEINPASNAAALRNEIASLKAKLSYQTLAGMKASGIGGLGQISDGDMILLGNASGALNPDTDNATMQRQLAVIRQKVQDAYNNSLTADDRALIARQTSQPNQAAPQSGTRSAPSVSNW